MTKSAHSFRCSLCGKLHQGLPDLGFRAPDQYVELSDKEKKNASISTDLCRIRDEYFFVRGVLPIPIRDRADDFHWGVWVSLSRENFERYLALYEEPDPQGGPYFGWLSNRIPDYPETLGLKTNVHLRPYPGRPEIELQPSDHPLVADQRRGIELDRLLRLLHDKGAFGKSADWIEEEFA